MSTPKKPDPARGWMFVEKRLAEEEADRVEKLPDDELLAEVRHQGADPARIPSGAEYLARATARVSQRP